MLLSRTALAVVLALVGNEVSAEETASFQKTVGFWTIAGDRSAGGCLLLSRSDSATKMTIAMLPRADTIKVALSNTAWRSLEDNSDAKIDATFSDGQHITDSWQLASTFTSAENGGPRINFEIERAANDGASFIDQMKKAQRLTYWRKGTLSLGSFSLKDSSKAIDALYECRNHLRSDPNFDPFAG